MQTSFFDHLELQYTTFTLSDGLSLQYYSAFLAERANQERWLAALQEETPWQQPQITIAGRSIPIPRLQAWYGDKEAHYQYSGTDFEPLPWTKTLLLIKEKIESISGDTYNSALINCYRDGKDSVSWHADDEPEIDQTQSIASFSLGAMRQFRLKHKLKPRLEKIVKLALNHGDLLIMPAGMQLNWLHEIPKSNAIDDMRINITFRRVIR